MCCILNGFRTLCAKSGVGVSINSRRTSEKGTRVGRPSNGGTGDTRKRAPTQKGDAALKERRYLRGNGKPPHSNARVLNWAA